MKTALLIHGAYGNPDENWIPWLKQELERNEYEVITPSFPTPKEQNLEKWLEVVEPHLSKLSEESVLVGHSVGAVFLLSVLEELNISVKTVIFVSGFLHDLGNQDFDSINRSFYEKNFDWERIRSSAQNITVFHGDNDPNVLLQEGRVLADRLNTELKVIKDGGHLNESAGYKEFPELLVALRLRAS